MAKGISNPRPRYPPKDNKGQSTLHHLVSYLDEETICLTLMHLNLRHWAYIYHDKDVYLEDDESRGIKKGDPKEPHYHILLSLVNKTTSYAVVRQFRGYFDDEGQPINTFGRICTDKSYEFDYLDHSRPDCVLRGDYRYDFDLIKTDKISYWQSGTHTDRDMYVEMFCELYTGVPYPVLLCKYGKPFLFHFERLRNAAVEMARNDRFDPKENYMINKPIVYDFME